MAEDAPTQYYVQISEDGGPFIGGEQAEAYAMAWETFDGGVIGHGPSAILPAGFSGNWIKVAVSNGCDEQSVSKQVLRCPTATQSEHPPSFFIASKTEPCQGFSDGSVTLAIPKNLGGEVSVVLNEGFEIPLSDHDEDFYYVEIGNLRGDFDYQLLIEVGGCTYDFPFRVGERAPERVLDRLENGKCFYDEACGDISMEHEQYQEPAWLDFPNSTHLFPEIKKCRTPWRCGHQVAGWKVLEKKKRRALHYMNSVNNMHNSPFYPSGYQAWIQDVAENKGVFNNLCKNIRYCRESLYPITSGPNSPHSSYSNESTFGDGCIGIECNFLVGNLSYCPHQADLFGGLPPVTVENCFPRRRNVFELIGHMSALEEEHGMEFMTSQLYLFLSDNLSNPKAACAYVLYCSRDFSFISSNIELVNCGVPLYSCGVYVGESCSPVPVYSASGNIVGYRVLCESIGGISNCAGSIGGGEPSVITLCAPPAAEPIPTVILCPKFFQPTNQDGEPSIKVILDAYSGERLLNFGISQEGPLANPKGLVQTAQGFVLDDFDPLGERVIKEKTDTVTTHYADDWEKNLLCFIEELQPGAAYRLLAQDSAAYWARSLSVAAGGMLQIRHLSITQSGVDEILAGGVFSGELSLDSSLVASYPRQSGFIARLGFDGTVSSFNLFADLSDVLFSENSGGALAIAGKRSGPIWVNGQEWAMPAGHGATVLHISEADQVSLARNVELLSGAFDLVDIAIDVAGGDAAPAIALWGVGAIQTGGQSFSYADEQLIILADHQQNGQTLAMATPAANISKDYFDMAFGENGRTMLLGLTIDSTALVFGKPFQSAGGQDIVLALIDLDNGLLGWDRQYGGAENENVAQVFYNQGYLYFGGEFGGSIGDKTIGSYVFSNLAASDKRAYVSFIAPGASEEVLALSQVEEPGSWAESHAMPLANSAAARRNVAEIELFPNPFSGKVSVRLSGMQVGKVQIADALGRPMHLYQHGQPGDFELDLSGLPRGVYFFKFYDERGTLAATKRMVKIE